MKNIIIGTAGHVDHGKTTLIKAMTGTNTDRLKEEQERGMTIDLGFASLRLPNGQDVSIVDVPGHERFIKNMLAGAGGVDVALMVIAADESVMPQTVEHLEILELLEVRRGVVALTKSDMVDPEWLEVVEEDVRKALSRTFLAEAPIVPVASTVGTGVPELLAALQEAVEHIGGRDPLGSFRLPVDRVFSMTGFGTVVTGTLLAGTVRVGDPVGIEPAGRTTRVRQLHVHGKKVESAAAGSRVAINLVGLEIEDLARGDVVTSPGTLKASHLIDLRLNLLQNAAKPLKSGSRVRLHVGTAEIIGRMVLLGKDELRPGDQSYAQFRSETPTAAFRGDRFVIRTYSPMVTIGGGVVIDPAAIKHKRHDEAVISGLEASSKGTPAEAVEQALKQATVGATIAEITKNSGIADAPEIVRALLESGGAVELDGGRVLHAARLGLIADKVREGLTQFHSRNPLKPGMSREELRNSAASGFDSRLFASILAHLESSGAVRTSDTLALLPDFEPRLTPAQQTAMEGMSTRLHDAGINVPSQEELLETGGLPTSGAREVLDLLVYKGEVVKIAEGMYFHHSTIQHAESLVREHLQKTGKITVSEFRDLTNSSRKYALPILEYFDSRKITRRVGDERVLAKSIGLSAQGA